jgi:hypothetical protein
MLARTAIVGAGVSVFLLAACASIPANAPAYSRAPDAADGRTNVYVYRRQVDGENLCTKARLRTLFVDGRPAFDLLPGAYTFLSLGAGQHRLQLRSSGCPEGEFYLHVEGGRSRYVRVRDSRIVVTLPNGLTASGIETVAEEIAEPIAESELQACRRYVAADPLPSEPAPGDTLIRGHR